MLHSLRPALALAAFTVGLCAAVIGLQGPGGTRAQAAADFCTQSNDPLSVLPTMPPKFPPFLQGAEDFQEGQTTADCQAWQQFIYMNWPALPGAQQYGMPDPKASFGTSNVARTVWESYHRPADIFVANPSPVSRPHKLRLGAISKFLGNAVSFAGTGQAFSGGWIVGRHAVPSTDGRLRFPPLVFYDVWVDRDEQDYIWRNQLQYASVQRACAGGPAGLRLPTGGSDFSCQNQPAKYGLGIGAVEIKAALLDLGPAPLDRGGNFNAAAAAHMFPTFLLFPQAVDLQYPQNDTVGGRPIGLQRDRLVGLVGLHIIRKMPGAQQFLWSTFEHVDNDPTPAQARSPRPWNFYNAATPLRSPNVNPNPCPSSGCDYGSSQIVRLTPLDSIAVQANASFHAVAPAASVFQHYELVQVQWPTNDAPLPKGAGGGPLNTSAFFPQSNVANSTLETYFQTLTCIQCHSGATVPTPPPPGARLGAQHGHHVFVVHPSKQAVPRPNRSGGRTVGDGPTPTPVPQPTGTPYASDFSFLLGDFALSGSPAPSPSPAAR